MYTIFAIAAGGAIGAVLRHYAGAAALHTFGPNVPYYGTFFVNITGSFIMGVLIAFFTHIGNPAQEVRAFLTVGMLGAFTTFSTFSLDTVNLYEEGNICGAAAYVSGSVVLSIAALFAGLSLVRAVVA